VAQPTRFAFINHRCSWGVGASGLRCIGGRNPRLRIGRCVEKPSRLRTGAKPDHRDNQLLDTEKVVLYLFSRHAP